MEDKNFTIIMGHAKDILGRSEVQVLPVGRNNWVLSSGNNVLSIPRDFNKTYSTRVAAMKRLRSAGVNVPEIIKYSSEKKQFPFEYLITKKINATSLQLGAINQKDRDIAHHEAGRTLRRIHEITVQRFGRLDGSLNGNHKTWISFVEEYFEKSMKTLMSTPVLFNKFHARFQQFYAQHEYILQRCTVPSFLHGDYHMGNLTYSGMTLAAVLDLDNATGGDPHWDIGHYQHTFNTERNLGITHFLKGYASEVNSEKARFYSFIIWARKVSVQAIQRPEVLKETIPELESILDGG